MCPHKRAKDIVAEYHELLQEEQSRHRVIASGVGRTDGETVNLENHSLWSLVSD